MNAKKNTETEESYYFNRLIKDFSVKYFIFY